MRGLLALLSIALAACSAQAAAPSTLPTGTIVASAVALTETAGATAATPTLQFPAPVELQGRWRTVLGPNDKPILTIRPTTYAIERFDMGSGGIEMHGDEIDFLASHLSVGIGRCRWSIAGNQLSLTSIKPDECPGRADALRDRTYTRLG